MMRAMRRIHAARHARPFTQRYWGFIALVLTVPTLISLRAGMQEDVGLQLSVAIPLGVSILVLALLWWRWSTHHIEVTDDAVIERRHPVLVYRRTRRLDEIVEVAPAPPERRELEHDDGALLLRCDQPHRDLVIMPENPVQFLDDLQAVDPRFARYRGRLVRARG